MEYVKKGNSCFINGDYDKAKFFYKKSIDLYPDLAVFLKSNITICNDRLTEVGYKIDDKYSGVFSRDHPASDYFFSHQVYSVDVVIPVYNALEDLKKCLFSVSKNRGLYCGKNYIVNDASDIDTTNYLRDFCNKNSDFILIEHDKNYGYTKTVNDGLRQSKSDFVVTLNSDTIVTRGWLQGLVRCICSDEKIGIVGPLSNAASWQNIPNLLDENNHFAINELLPGDTPDSMAELVQNVSHHIYPRVPFINGFCFMIAREVINRIGYLDEEGFPTGYGEENDYCLRASDAGFDLAIADDTYVFHAKSKSFGHEKRKIYSKNGSEKLKNKHGKDRVNSLIDKIKKIKELDEIRLRVKNKIIKGKEYYSDNRIKTKIAFLLPVSGGGGGVHSIVQETIGFQRVGLEAKILVPKKHLHKFLLKYEDVLGAEDLFIGYENSELIERSKYFDIIIGTIYTSMKLIKKIIDCHSNIQPAYYIQDYEPLFSSKGLPEWKEARDSYNLIPNAILFAKTEWICNKVYDEHGVLVKKVEPSIDHSIYKPNFLEKQIIGEKIVVSAMIRPKTPRRGAKRTMLALKRLKNRFGEKVRIEIFGCSENDPLFLKLDRDFEYINHGELSRIDVARVLQRSHVFLDLSDYQAFGRTGLEAMACGAFVVLTQYGGVHEYAKDYKNSLIVDPFNPKFLDDIFKYIENVVIKDIVNINGIETAAKYSIHRSAISEFLVLV